MILANEINIGQISKRKFIIQVDLKHLALRTTNFLAQISPYRNFALNIKSRSEYSLKRFKPMKYILVKFHEEKFLIQIDHF